LSDALVCCVWYFSETELETCCSVLSKLLDVVDPAAILSNFHSELLDGLDSESETVRHLCLVQVPRLFCPRPPVNTDLLVLDFKRVIFLLVSLCMLAGLKPYDKEQSDSVS